MESFQSLLAKTAGLPAVKTGDTIALDVSYCLVNDAYSHQAVDCLQEHAALFNPRQVAVIIDHDTPSGSVAASSIQRKLINFAKRHDTLYHHGEGPGYQLLLDRYVQAGEIVVGIGKHLTTVGAAGALGITVKPDELAQALTTGVVQFQVPSCVKIEITGRLSPGVLAKDLILTVLSQYSSRLTGKAIEFTGDAFASLTLNDRITICNLAGKTGAVTAVINGGEQAVGSAYEAVYRLDAAAISPAIVKPDSYDDIVAVKAVAGLAVNEVFIGGCSAGRIEDLRLAAAVMAGRKVAKGVRLLIAPITSEVYVQALREGLISAFIEAGAVIMNQGCSVCWGKSQGIIDTNEVLLSAGSYNDKGWAGAETAAIYIASAATAAASAIAGVITEAEVAR